MRRRAAALVTWACLSWAAADARAFSAGVDGASGKTAGKTCAGCHANGTPPMSATITGPAMVLAGAPTTFTLEVVTGSDAAQVGFDIASSAGALGTAGGAVATQLLAGEVTHTTALGSGATVQVQFNLTPDTPNSTLTLYAAALRHDPANAQLKDGTITTTLDVTVGDAADLAGMAPPDMAMASARDEPRWSCDFAPGARQADGAPLLVGLLLLLLTAAGSSARTARRRGR
jgi:hypothetical protein